MENEHRITLSFYRYLYIENPQGFRDELYKKFNLLKVFGRVFHLEGGIIQYANKVKEENLENKFLGKNFVFDGRLGEKVGKEIISHCHQCGSLSDTHTNCANEGCHLLFIQCEKCEIEFDGCFSAECKSTYILPEEQQKEKRKGVKNGMMVFKCRETC